ncbi:MAG: radical SAM protein [bacterium]
MKILLVRPVTPREIVHNLVPPIGLGYLASSLRKSGHEPRLLDCARARMSLRQFQKAVAEWQPDVVGFHTFSCDVRSVAESARAARAAQPDAVIVVGGAHPTGVREKLFDHVPDADYGFVGEAEDSFARFVESLPSGRPDLDVPGLIFKLDGAVRCNRQSFTDDLSSLEFPAWDMMPPADYPGSPMGIFFRRSPVAPMVATRGCPCACTFCTGRLLHGKTVRRRTAQNIAEEMELLVKNFGVREVHFLDDNFSSSREFVLEVCEEVSARFPGLAWCCPNGLRLDTLDRELLLAMKRAGCYSISVGVESGSAEILRRMKKGLTKEKTEEKVALIKEAGLDACGFFILGFPGETEQTIEETISFALSLPLDRASFFNFLPLPGATVTEELAAKGEIGRVDYEQLHYIYTPYLSPGLTAEKLKSAQRRAFLRFFLRPKILLGALSRLRSWNQLALLITRAFGYLR